ncbi:MAG: ABC transporter ATP-binding protein NatA [candidate division WS2 bacterium]|nr:ABC transporter ATP-binding protein NatA [Candidatus Psychracetigena formicireducens]
MENNNYAVKTIDIKRTFKKSSNLINALKGISLTVNRGEFFGVLGRNGAGKTTFLKILSTLLYPTSGQAWVGGWDVQKDGQNIREIINLVSGGEESGYGILNVRENLWMFSQFYGIPSSIALKRIDKYLEMFGLKDQAKTRVSALSTGMRQKMNLIRGLLNNPEILFLDEPTVGLDVESARHIRSFLKDWIKENDRTIILTTHYMLEADELSERLAIIEGGEIIALGTPSEFKGLSQTENFYELTVNNFPESLDINIEGVQLISKLPQNGNTILKIRLKEDSLLSELLASLNQHGTKLELLKKKEPTLEDAFVNLVGKSSIDVSGA